MTSCVASSKTIRGSFLKALKSDKKSAFGGVVLVNKKIDGSFAKMFVKDFYEALVSPSFSREAIKILSKRKNLILINLSRLLIKKERKELKNNKREKTLTIKILPGDLLISKEST